MPVFRSPDNPIITPKDVKPSRDDFEVIGAFNTAVTRYRDDIILLLRIAERPISPHPDIELTAIYDPQTNDVTIKEFSKTDPAIDFSDPRMTVTPYGKFLTSLSHFRVAKSKDGINFDISDSPAMFPTNAYETFGIEDPRISLIEDTYYITYVAVSPMGVTTSLASTKDFTTFVRHGIIFCPDNKDVVIFPKKIGGKFYAIHRPVTPLFEKYEMWLANSNDLICWGNHQFLIRASNNEWDCSRLGAGAVPFEIEQGWLEIYHGVDNDNRYCLGAILLDKENPSQIIARSKTPILQPQADYEIEGFFGNVAFTCGLLHENNTLRIYYGVSDTSTAYAEIPLQDVLNNLQL